MRNLMRNLGGAIGLALIDTVLYSRAPVLGGTVITQLQAGDAQTLQDLGLPAGVRVPATMDAATQALLAPMISKLAFVQAMNEAWGLVCAITMVADRFADPKPVRQACRSMPGRQRPK